MTDTDDTASYLVRLPDLLKQRPFLTERWVRSLVAAGTLPHFKLGGRLLFDLREVDEAVKRGHEAD